MCGAFDDSPHFHFIHLGKYSMTPGAVCAEILIYWKKKKTKNCGRFLENKGRTLRYPDGPVNRAETKLSSAVSFGKKQVPTWSPPDPRPEYA